MPSALHSLCAAPARPRSIPKPFDEPRSRRRTVTLDEIVAEVMSRRDIFVKQCGQQEADDAMADFLLTAISRGWLDRFDADTAPLAAFVARYAFRYAQDHETRMFRKARVRHSAKRVTQARDAMGRVADRVARNETGAVLVDSIRDKAPRPGARMEAREFAAGVFDSLAEYLDDEELGVLTALYENDAQPRAVAARLGWSLERVMRTWVRAKRSAREAGFVRMTV